MEPAKIAIGGQVQEVPLALPKSFAARRAIISCGMDINTSTADRVAAGTLGLCWGHPTMRLRADFARCQYDLLTYGGMVLDDLGEKGWNLDQVCLAGLDAWKAVRDSLVSPASTDATPRARVEDIVEQADFSHPQKEDSTPSPDSSESPGLAI